jgi:hypothetical protein
MWRYNLSSLSTTDEDYSRMNLQSNGQPLEVKCKSFNYRVTINDVSDFKKVKT